MRDRRTCSGTRLSAVEPWPIMALLTGARGFRAYFNRPPKYTTLPRFPPKRTVAVGARVHLTWCNMGAVSWDRYTCANCVCVCCVCSEIAPSHHRTGSIVSGVYISVRSVVIGWWFVGLGLRLHSLRSHRNQPTEFRLESLIRKSTHK